jgi:hypothetical protein
LSQQRTLSVAAANLSLLTGCFPFFPLPVFGTCIASMCTNSIKAWLISRVMTVMWRHAGFCHALVLHFYMLDAAAITSVHISRTFSRIMLQ